MGMYGKKKRIILPSFATFSSSIASPKGKKDKEVVSDHARAALLQVGTGPEPMEVDNCDNPHPFCGDSIDELASMLLDDTNLHHDADSRGHASYDRPLTLQAKASDMSTDISNDMSLSYQNNIPSRPVPLLPRISSKRYSLQSQSQPPGQNQFYKKQVPSSASLATAASLSNNDRPLEDSERQRHMVAVAHVEYSNVTNRCSFDDDNEPHSFNNKKQRLTSKNALTKVKSTLNARFSATYRDSAPRRRLLEDELDRASNIPIMKSAPTQLITKSAVHKQRERADKTQVVPQRTIIKDLAKTDVRSVVSTGRAFASSLTARSLVNKDDIQCTEGEQRTLLIDAESFQDTSRSHLDSSDLVDGDSALPLQLQRTEKRSSLAFETDFDVCLSSSPLGASTPQLRLDSFEDERHVNLAETDSSTHRNSLTHLSSIQQTKKHPSPSKVELEELGDALGRMKGFPKSHTQVTPKGNQRNHIAIRRDRAVLFDIDCNRPVPRPEKLLQRKETTNLQPKGKQRLHLQPAKSISSSRITDRSKSNDSDIDELQ